MGVAKNLSWEHEYILYEVTARKMRLVAVNVV